MYANYSGCRSVSNQRGRDYNVRSRSLAKVRGGKDGWQWTKGDVKVREWRERERRWRVGRAVTSVGTRADAVALRPQETGYPVTGEHLRRSASAGKQGTRD